MVEPTGSGDRTKVLSVRFTEAEFEALAAHASELGIGPSTLARTLVRQGLGTSPTTASPRVGPAQTSLLEDRLVGELVARVEALERWVSDHDVPQR